MKNQSQRSKRNARGAARSSALERLYVEPMKALGVSTIPDGDWLVEIKLDGYRALATLAEGTVELWSRNRNALSARFPEVAAAVQRIKCADAVLDGEIVALSKSGHSSFQLLQRLDQLDPRPPILYYVFDLLRLDGTSLVDRPLEQRQAALKRLLGRSTKGVVRLSPVFDVAPAELLARAREQGLEGIIAKARGSLYEPGRRSGAWLKCRLRHEQEFVIGGFTPPGGSRKHFGAILLGYYLGDRLVYAGKVGSGFDARRLSTLHKEFLRLRRDSCPFANLPMPQKSRFGQGMTAREMREVTWLEPKLVAQIEFSEFTEEGLVRQGVFLGLRDDKSARDVVREVAAGNANGQ